ncbi:MAG: GntR family transcriptional regulator [Niabella sp.]|nr:GntR family transcriptional regulator [Niabella sp.]
MKEKSLANLVYGDIRQKILANQLRAGSRLAENTWAKKLEVSRVAVREALIRLSGEGLVEFGERGGCFVRSITSDDVKEIKDLREILETGALRLLFKYKDKKTIQKLEQICNDFSSMIERGYYSGACEADVKFHEVIIKGAKNERLNNIYINSNIPLFHFKLSNSSQVDDYTETDIEHRRIVECLKNNDLKGATTTLLQHLDRGEKLMLELSPLQG